MPQDWLLSPGGTDQGPQRIQAVRRRESVEDFPPRRPTRRTQRFLPDRRKRSIRDRHHGEVGGKPRTTRSASMASKWARNWATQAPEAGASSGVGCPVTGVPVSRDMALGGRRRVAMGWFQGTTGPKTAHEWYSKTRRKWHIPDDCHALSRFVLDVTECLPSCSCSCSCSSQLEEEEDRPGLDWIRSSGAKQKRHEAQDRHCVSINTERKAQSVGNG
mgnify:CR=1 FL=1